MSGKSELRKKYIQIRKELSQDLVMEAETNLLNIVQSNSHLFLNKRIACYSSIRNEIPTQSLIELFLDMKSDIYLPEMIEGSKILKFKQLETKEAVKENSLGILEPTSNKEIDPSDLEIILLPCVCFDAMGYRIGMGKGYYDYSLANISTPNLKLIILAYDFQKIEHSFPEKHDIKADACITDKKFYKF